MTFIEIIKYELSYIFRKNSKIPFFLLILPIIYILIFGSIYSENVIKHIPILIYDQDQTAVSLNLVKSIGDSERCTIVSQVTTQEEMDALFYTNEALAAVIIPPKFAQDIKLGRSSEVMIIINTDNLSMSNTIISSVTEIVQTLSVGIGQKTIEGLSQMPSQALATVTPIRLAIRIFHNPTLSYSAFSLPGMGINVLQLTIMLSICGILVREYTNINVLEKASAPLIVIGKLIPYWLGAMIAYGIYLSINIIIFGIPLREDIWGLLLIGTAFTFALVNVGTFYSAFAPNELRALQIPVGYIMPSYLFSGYNWPLIEMNDFCRALAAIMPLTYVADTIRDLLLAGYSPVLFKNAGILFAFGATLFTLSVMIFARRRKKLLNKASLEVSL